MPQPPFLTTDTAARDADILRRKLSGAKNGVLDLFGVPQGSVIGDPAREQKLEESSEEVAKITAKLALLTKVVPQSIPRNILIFFAGVKHTPTGDTKITPGTAGNFAPAPIGFLDPTAVGLSRNFYLPAGSTQLIPRQLDQFGFGLPEQRLDDQVRSEGQRAAVASSQLKGATNAVANESDDTLRDLAAGRGGISRAGVVIATSGESAADLFAAAKNELDRRAGGPGAPAGPWAAVAGLAHDATGRVASSAVPVINAGVMPGGPTDPLGKPPPDASIQPEKIEPVNDAAKRNAASAKGIRRELVSERADP